MNASFTIMTLVLLVILMSTISAQVDWEKYENNPVLVPGSPGEWDDYSLKVPCILFDGSTYHLWYGGHDGSIDRIGYATSPDGKVWEKYGGNPVLNEGIAVSWDDGGVGMPCVLLIDSTYHMWYNGGHEGRWRIGYATSADGTTWTKYAGNPVLDVGPIGSWTEKGVGGPNVIFDGSSYQMWIDGWSASDTICIGYATSFDGKIWTMHEDNPVLKPGPTSWDSRTVEDPNVFFDGSTYHMWYTGSSVLWWEWRIGYATSSDGITWTKNTGNPILTPDMGKWDAQYTGFCNVLRDSVNSLFNMWYAGGTNSFPIKFGYATAPDTITSGIYHELSANLPSRFALMQNYPNPFNPTTTIKFTIPKSEYVELKVFNLLGKEVTTLVSNKLTPGNHTYRFDGKNLASGIYYYQIVTRRYMEVKKMILLR
jgi:predicted GH43/DUF377 family glycosyl hydrolase